MGEADDSDGPLDAVTGLVAVATLPAGILAGMFVSGQAAGVVFVVGWLLLVPALGILSDHVDLGERTEESGLSTGVEADTEDDEALQRLRERYAAGEIDEAEFERRVERLLETEDVEERDPVTGPASERAGQRELE